MAAGTTCVGYDLSDVQFVDDDAEEARTTGKMPDVVVVRKLYGGLTNTNPKRVFQLQRLDVDVVVEDDAFAYRDKRVRRDQEVEMMDEEDFLRELESDKEMRSHINLFKSKVRFEDKHVETGQNAVDTCIGETEEEDIENEDDQKVTLDELLDGLVLDGGPDMKNSGINEERYWDGFGNSNYAEGEKASKDGISYAGRYEVRHFKEKQPATPVDGNIFGKEFLDKK